MTLNYFKALLNTAKFDKGLRDLFPSYVHFVINGSNVSILFSFELSVEDQEACAFFVENFTDYTSAEQLEIYLESSVFPFVKSLINKFASENISMGITQLGKSGHVLSLFSKDFPIPSIDFKNSLKNCFDTGSLYVALDVLQHIRSYPIEFEGLAPFVTDARLRGLKNDIEIFLGLTLSE